MLQTEKKGFAITALYSTVVLMLVYTLFRIYLKYNLPFIETGGTVYEELSAARTYELAGNLLLTGSFLLPGIYLAWTDRKFRTKFPLLEFFHLVFINIIVIK